MNDWYVIRRDGSQALHEGLEGLALPDYREKGKGGDVCVYTQLFINKSDHKWEIACIHLKVKMFIQFSMFFHSFSQAILLPSHMWFILRGWTEFFSVIEKTGGSVLQQSTNCLSLKEKNTLES